MYGPHVIVERATSVGKCSIDGDLRVAGGNSCQVKRNQPTAWDGHGQGPGHGHGSEHLSEENPTSKVFLFLSLTRMMSRHASFYSISAVAPGWPFSSHRQFQNSTVIGSTRSMRPMLLSRRALRLFLLLSQSPFFRASNKLNRRTWPALSPIAPMTSRFPSALAWQRVGLWFGRCVSISGIAFGCFSFVTNSWEAAKHDWFSSMRQSRELSHLSWLLG